MSKTDRDRPRLGRGLSTLLSSPQRQETPAQPPPVAVTISSKVGPPTPDAASGSIEIPVRSITPNPSQPRRRFDETALAELAASLRSTGLIQPIIVRRANGGFQLIAGERRWRAAQMAQLQTIPAIVRDVDGSTQAQMALVENIQREDLNPIERAEAYQQLIDQLSLTQGELSERLGEDRSAIANHLRLLSLAPEARELVVAGSLSLGHAKVLAGLEDLAKQVKLAQSVVAEDFSVRQLEAAIRQGDDVAAPKAAQPSAHIGEMEKTISRQLGMRVQVKSVGKSKGRVVIHYGSLDQFDELIGKLGVKLDTE
jgi:ParB family chromosome partitioning protein